MKFDLEKMEDKVIHCDTEEKAKQLLEFLDGQGYKWNCTNDGLTTHSNFLHGKNTCYAIYNCDKTITHKAWSYFNNNTKLKVLEFEDVLITDKPRICEITGLEIGEKFNIKGYVNNPCAITQTGNILDCEGKNPHSVIILNIIQNTTLIKKIPTYTDEQKEIFKALRLLGFNYMARDEGGSIWLYSNKPNKFKFTWHGENSTRIKIDEIYYLLKYFVEWEDAEPFKIPDLEGKSMI